jgi:hypothetical protein
MGHAPIYISSQGIKGYKRVKYFSQFCLDLVDEDRTEALARPTVTAPYGLKRPLVLLVSLFHTTVSPWYIARIYDAPYT